MDVRGLIEMEDDRFLVSNGKLEVAQEQRSSPGSI